MSPVAAAFPALPDAPSGPDPICTSGPSDGRGHLLLIEPDARAAITLLRALCPLARVRLASGLADAQAQAAVDPPELVLVSDRLPEAAAGDLAACWQALPDLAGLPRMALTAGDDPAHEALLLDGGALGCLPRRADAVLLRSRVQVLLQLLRSAARWRHQAERDALTGLAGRHHIDEVLLREWRLARRQGRPLALLMIDIDHFKAFNDHHGHPAGDDCLRQVAQVLQQALRRPTDLAGRWGGEEFLVLLSETDLHGALVVAQLLREALAERNIHHGGLPGPQARVTASIGVAAWTPGSGDADCAGDGGVQSLLATADAALYEAKRGGRDAVQWQLLPQAPLRLHGHPLHPPH